MRARPFVFHLLSLLPAALSSGIGARVAPLVAPRQMPLRHRRARANLEMLRPGLGPREADAVLTRRWANLGRYLFELPVLGKLAWPANIAIDPDFIDAITDPGPLIIVSVHIGNWELLGSYLFNQSGRTGVGVFQQRDDPAQAALLHKARGNAMAAAVAPGLGAARQAVRALGGDNHPAVLLLLDERREGQVWFPFFGRKAPPSGNLSTALRLAKLTGARILPLYLERVEGTRFCLHWHPRLALEDLGEAELVGRLDTWFGAAVMRHADQWLALHDMDAKAALGFEPQQSDREVS